MTENKPKPESAELLRQLASPDSSLVLKALNRLQKVANLNDLPSIIRVMAGLTDSGLMDEFTTFLSNVKSKGAPPILATFLADPAFTGIRPNLTRSCWESQLDYSPHLMLFAHLFIAGDYLLALEAFTVIENTCFEYPVNRSLVKEISILVKNSIPDQPEAKKRLVQELILVLEPFLSGDQ